MTGQLALDDCTPDWAPAEPKRRRPAGTRYHLSPYSGLRGQGIPDSRRRIVTVPTTGEYV